MLHISDTFHNGHLHHPQCCVIRCTAGVVINTLEWEEIHEQLAREGSRSKALRFLDAREFSVLLPLLL